MRGHAPMEDMSLISLAVVVALLAVLVGLVFLGRWLERRSVDTSRWEHQPLPRTDSATGAVSRTPGTGRGPKETAV